MASTRLPGKPLELLDKRPMVVCVAEQARLCNNISGVFVATDSREILATVADFGIATVITSDTHLSGSDRVAEAAQKLGVDAVVNVQADEPFIDPADIDALATAVTAPSNIEMATLRAIIDNPEELDDPNVVKVVCRADGRAMYFSRAAIPHHRSQTFPRAAYRHIGVYAYRLTALNKLTCLPPDELELTEGLEQLRALRLGLDIQVFDAKSPCSGIDTPKDLNRARSQIRKLGHKAFPGHCGPLASCRQKPAQTNPKQV